MNIDKNMYLILQKQILLIVKEYALCNIYNILKIKKKNV